MFRRPRGSREVFDVNVITKGCTAFRSDKAFKARDGKTTGCIALRTNGWDVEIEGDYTKTRSRLKSGPQGVGVFGMCRVPEDYAVI